MTGMATIRRTRKRGKGPEEDLDVGRLSEEVDVPVGAAPKRGTSLVAEVRYAQGVTLNLGNYESQRVDVDLRMPCRAEPGAIDSAYDYAREWVDARLAEEIKAIRGDAGKDAA